MPALPDHGLYVITGCAGLSCAELLDKTEQILASGAAMLQYRNKNAEASVKRLQAARLLKLCRKYHVPFIINDDHELALMVNADGIHIGRDDISCEEARKALGPGRIIGVSCYNELDRAIAAEETGANYIAFGSFFSSRTKPHAVQAGTELLSMARSRLHVPIAAIGGITPENAGGIIDAGADFVAASSALYDANDPAVITRQFVRLFNWQTAGDIGGGDKDEH